MIMVKLISALLATNETIMRGWAWGRDVIFIGMSVCELICTAFYGFQFFFPLR